MRPDRRRIQPCDGLTPPLSGSGLEFSVPTRTTAQANSQAETSTRYGDRIGSPCPRAHRNSRNCCALRSRSMSVGGHARTNWRTISARWLPKSSNVRGKTAVILCIRFSCENRASRSSRARLFPQHVKSIARSPRSPNMALLLVRYSSRRTCLSNSRSTMHKLRSLTSYPRADARHIVKDFITVAEAVVALDDDCCRRLANASIVEEIKRSVGYRVGMGIGEKWSSEPRVVHGHAAGQMHFLYDAGRQGIEELAWVESVVTRIQIKVLKIQEQASARFPADQIEKLGI